MDQEQGGQQLMADKKSNLKDAIMDLAKSIEGVFRKYTRPTRERAWEKITGKDGEKEIKKIMVNPNRQLDMFRKLVNQREGTERKEFLRVWLDDERPMPVNFDLRVETAQEAIDMISSGRVSMISLDHDLGGEENGTGYEVAKFVEKGAFMGTIEPMEIRLHSANPVGRRNMQRCIENANRFWGAS